MAVDHAVAVVRPADGPASPGGARNRPRPRPGSPVESYEK